MRHRILAMVCIVVGPVIANSQATSTGLPALKEDLAAEVSAREAADTLIEARIGGEEARAATAEQDLRTLQAELQSQLDRSSAAIETEQSARTAGDAQLQSAVGAEITSRGQADQQLHADVAAEVSARAEAIAAVRTQDAQELAALAAELRSSAAREASGRRAADDASIVALHAEVERLRLEVRVLTNVVTQAKAALASTNALDVTAQRAGVVSAACSPELETLVLSTEARLAASLDTAARATIVREASFLTRSPLNASAFSGVATRIGSTGSTPDNIMETLLVVMKESINEANEDKKYYLQKLATYNEIAEALSDQLQDLVSAAGGLNGGSACDGSDEDPLSSQVQAEISGRLDGAKAALALACCAPGRDPYDCSFIMDPASCPSGPDDEVKTDVPLGVPATVGELRALSSFARAKLTAARTSRALLTRNIAEVTDRTSALCQELSRVVTTAP